MTAWLDEDRLFSTDPMQRDIARHLYEGVRDMPILSPHGHTDPRWFAENKRFDNPASLFVTPDHYVFRMLHSQDVSLEELGIVSQNDKVTPPSPRSVWRLFAKYYYLFRGTPSRLWLDHAFQEVFGIGERLTEQNADAIYDEIDYALGQGDYLPRALYDRFNISCLATTESPLDDLRWHQQIRDSGWSGRVITTYRPDDVVDPDYEGFSNNVMTLGEITGEDTTSWQGYLAAHRKRRLYFKSFGATATDHGHPTARTENLPAGEAKCLFDKALRGVCTAEEADRFRGHMITEMARMSLEDGLVLQLHTGSSRNHRQDIFAQFGRDKGYDIPMRTDYVTALSPLLNAVGGQADLTIIVFTLDETNFSRELAPLAGVYPALKLGPPWWFLDSYEGMMRFRETVTETAGFYNTVGFNDDTRAFCSIPARHDVARRVDCAYLAQLVGTGRLDFEEAQEVSFDLTYNLAKQAYHL